MRDTCFSHGNLSPYSMWVGHGTCADTPSEPFIFYNLEGNLGGKGKERQTSTV